MKKIFLFILKNFYSTKDCVGYVIKPSERDPGRRCTRCKSCTVTAENEKKKKPLGKKFIQLRKKCKKYNVINRNIFRTSVRLKQKV